MSWFNSLYTTYENCFNNLLVKDSDKILPIYHSTRKIDLEIVLDSEGNYKRCEELKGCESVIAITESSESRSGGEFPHGLSEELAYCGGYILTEKKGIKKYKSYLDQLVGWCDSSFCNSDVAIILKYVKNKTIIEDLISSGVLCSINNRIKISENSIIKKGKDPLKIMVRWSIERHRDIKLNTWEDSEIIYSWVHYMLSKKDNIGFCCIKGEESNICKKHSKYIRYSGDRAKLVSSNDKRGFTYRGRFKDSDSSFSISSEVSQKAHNALKWLLRRGNSNKIDSSYIVSWSTKGINVPDFTLSTGGLLKYCSSDLNCLEQDIGLNFSKKLGKSFKGYGVDLSDNDTIFVMSIDSITSGRLSVKFYREFPYSDLIFNLEEWHLKYSWYQNSGGVDYIGTPSLWSMANFLQRCDSKSKTFLKNSFNRLVLCIIDGYNVPKDMVNRMVENAFFGIGKKGNYDRILSTACSMYKGNNRVKGEGMLLEENNTDRSYLYGRLVALADFIEKKYLKYSTSNRSTNAERLFTSMSKNPYVTWFRIYNKILPFKNKIKVKNPEFADRTEILLDDIISKYVLDDFKNNSRLSGEFLLGFSSQRKFLRENF